MGENASLQRSQGLTHQALQHFSSSDDWSGSGCCLVLSSDVIAVSPGRLGNAPAGWEQLSTPLL